MFQAPQSRAVSPGPGVEGIWHVPDVGNNRSLAQDQRFRVELYPMAYGDVDAMNTAIAEIVLRAQEEDNSELRYRWMFENRIGRVVNYRARNPKTGEVVEPTNGAQLYDSIKRDVPPAFGDRMIALIISALRDHNLIAEPILEPSGS